MEQGYTCTCTCTFLLIHSVTSLIFAENLNNCTFLSVHNFSVESHWIRHPKFWLLWEYGYTVNNKTFDSRWQPKSLTETFGVWLNLTWLHEPHILVQWHLKKASLNLFQPDSRDALLLLIFMFWARFYLGLLSTYSINVFPLCTGGPYIEGGNQSLP